MSEPVFSRHCRWFVSVRKQFAVTLWPLRGLPVRYLEIGCCEAMSTVWMFRNILTHPNSRAVVIDPWEVATWKRLDWKATEERARRNLEPWADRTTIIKGCWPAVKPQVEGIFDAIYIDAIHAAGPVYNDSVAAWPILNPGGLMLWDDWQNDVELGVAKFLREIGDCYQVLSQQLQLHVRKISDKPILWNSLK